MTEDNRTRWHRLAGLVLEPLFQKLGYETKVEYDLSKKQQFIDLIAVRRIVDTPLINKLPQEYWESFGELNEHNLISFKTYSESFTGYSMMELWGHYISYVKEKDLQKRQDSVNLYAITNHYPQKLLKEYDGCKLLKVIEPNEIVELQLPNFKSVRIILTRSTENPILSLFSGEQDKVISAYDQLQSETDLLQGVSRYLTEIVNYYHAEIPNMYTKEDFMRDHPPESQPLFAFPWEEEYHLSEIAKSKKQGEKRGEKRGEILGQLHSLEQLFQEGLLNEEQYRTRTEPLKVELKKLTNPKG